MTNEVNEVLSDLFDGCPGVELNSGEKEVRTSLLIEVISQHFAGDDEDIKLEMRDIFDPTYSDVLYQKEEFISKFFNWMARTTSDGAAKLNQSINSTADRSFEYMPSSTPVNSKKMWSKNSFQGSAFTPIAQPEFISDNFLSSPEKKCDGSSLDNSFVRSLKTSFYDVKSQLSQTRQRAESYETMYLSILENNKQLQKELQRLNEALTKKKEQAEEPEVVQIDSTAEKELAEYKSKLAQANAKISSLCETNHSLRQDIGKLKVQLLIASDSEKSLKQRMQNLKNEVTASNSRMMSLEAQLDTAQTKVSDLTLELRAAQLGKSESAINFEKSSINEDAHEVKSLFDEISAIEPITNQKDFLLSPSKAHNGSNRTGISCGVDTWAIFWPFLSLCILLLSYVMFFQNC